MNGEQKLITKRAMMYVTERELNEAYCTIINQHKSGIISEEKKRASTYIDDLRKLDFVFDITMGMKGSWLCVSEITVIPEASEN